MGFDPCCRSDLEIASSNLQGSQRSFGGFGSTEGYNGPVQSFRTKPSEDEYYSPGSLRIWVEACTTALVLVFGCGR